MVLTGVVVDGRVVFDGPITLPNGTPIRVEVPDPPAVDGPPAAELSFLERYKDVILKAEGVPGRTFLERMGDVVGKAEGLPEDAARNVDHYLYGHPKQ